MARIIQLWRIGVGRAAGTQRTFECLIASTDDLTRISLGRDRCSSGDGRGRVVRRRSYDRVRGGTSFTACPSTVSAYRWSGRLAGTSRYLPADGDASGTRPRDRWTDRSNDPGDRCRARLRQSGESLVWVRAVLRDRSGVVRRRRRRSYLSHSSSVRHLWGVDRGSEPSHRHASYRQAPRPLGIRQGCGSHRVGRGRTSPGRGTRSVRTRPAAGRYRTPNRHARRCYRREASGLRGCRAARHRRARRWPRTDTAGSDRNVYVPRCRLSALERSELQLDKHQLHRHVGPDFLATMANVGEPPNPALNPTGLRPAG
jgi:hypothetical protein